MGVSPRPLTARRAGAAGRSTLTGTGGMAYFLETMCEVIKVELGARSYDIRVGEGVLAKLGERCRDLDLGPSCLILSDSNVDLLYGQPAEKALASAGFIVNRAVIPAGEGSKSGEQLFALYGRAVKSGLDRRSFVVALGGGVVGDLGGFVAATYLRGITYVQAPTSLLAMVDSSVGGKTGINLPQGKNLVGAFHQPRLVLADTVTLKTLPAREYASGLAEVVKYGVIRDAALFAALESDADRLRAADPALLKGVIAQCCRIKADVVGADERESGLRAILNFGHTLAHAIEHAAGYGRFLHGEAVSIGMVYAARLSVELKGFAARDCARLEALLEKLGLPVRAPACEWQDIRGAMALDKKVAGRTPRFVLAEAIGRVAFGCEVPEELLRDTWEKCRD